MADLIELIAEAPASFEPGIAYVEVFGLVRPGQVYRMPGTKLEAFIALLRERDADFYEILNSTLDNCPVCGRRIKDYDDLGMEAEDGQRWCQAHHVVWKVAARSGGRITRYRSTNGRWELESQPFTPVWLVHERGQLDNSFARVSEAKHYCERKQ